LRNGVHGSDLGLLALIGSRTKLMQHRSDRIDHWLDPTVRKAKATTINFIASIYIDFRSRNRSYFWP
jgi:hypothetical protein